MKLVRMMTLSAVMLSLFAAITTGSVAFIAVLTKDRIAEREHTILQEKLHRLISAQRHDNDMASDVIVVTDNRLGSKKPRTIFRARHDKQPVACIINSIAPNGYSGNIELLVAINYDGTLAGVRVTQHHETPGLGDLIDENKSRWIFQFDGKSLLAPLVPKWKVRKDHGDFDQLTSATITSRAVVKAVYTTLEYYSQQRDIIFSTPALSEKSQG